MGKRWGWSPHGTARERLLQALREENRARELPQPTKLARFPFDVAEAASQYEDGEELVYVAWELARAAAGLDAGAHRALLLVALASLVHRREGSTRLPLEGALADETFWPLLRLLGASPRDEEHVRSLLRVAREDAASPVRAVLGPVGSDRPLVLDGAWLYQQRMRHAEDRLVEALLKRLDGTPRQYPSDAWNAAFSALRDKAPLGRGKPIKLSDEQLAAVERALTVPLAVVSGGPGTGKTSIVVSMLRALVRLGVPLESIAVAAPTGKAANRLDSAMKAYLRAIPTRDLEDEQLLAHARAPQTLHRLLGYSPSADRFLHHENNPLAERVVIIDESSMVDLFLMERLVRALRPEARLVLLGDAEQLPSVEAGAVFRDLVPAQARTAHAVRLTQSYRMDESDPSGRNILSVARAINDGDAQRAFPDPAQPKRETLVQRADARSLVFDKVELLDQAGAEPLPAFFERWLDERLRAQPNWERLSRNAYLYGPQGFSDAAVIDLKALFRIVESARLLCLTRGEGSPTGAEAVNRWFHERLLELARAGEPGGVRADVPFYPGEPVLMQCNDYDRGLFNGDQGVVLRVQQDGRQHFAAVFPRGETFVPFPLDVLRRDLSLAFAMTVHKSQGSEFDHVGLLLPEQDSPLLTREILYTAVTRARRSVSIVGARELFEQGVARRIVRHSGVAERLVPAEAPQALSA